MVRWEYQIVRPDLKHLTLDRKLEQMNELGREGWELVWGSEGGALYFKRAIPEPSPAK